MYKYFVEIFRYKENGSLESRPFSTQGCNNELELRRIYDQYAYEMQTDPDGNPTSMKAYKVRVYKYQYKMVADPAAEIASVFDLTM